MARARNIKPGFFKNEELSDFPFGCRLLFIGLWTLADREGRLEDRPRRIAAEIFPFDRDAEVEDWLDLLASGDDPFILRYGAGKSRFIAISKWHKHQTPHHMEVPSEVPPPDGTENRYNHSPVTKRTREQILKRDGYKCKQCGSSQSLHIDHVHPVSLGGTSDVDNLQTLCGLCNLKKRNKSTSNREQTDNELMSTREQVDASACRPTDSLIPSSLIPDSGFSDSPISDSVTDPAPRIVPFTSRRKAEEPKEWEHAQEFRECWNRHKKNRHTETFALVAQMLITRDNVKWDLIKEKHSTYCAYWKKNGWQFCPLTFLEWVDNEMPDPPEESSAPQQRNGWRTSPDIPNYPAAVLPGPDVGVSIAPMKIIRKGQAK